MKRYTLTVQRFSKSGKFYDNIEIKSDSPFIAQVVEEIKIEIKNGNLSDEFIYLITGEGHPDSYPQLVLNDKKN